MNQEAFARMLADYVLAHPLQPIESVTLFEVAMYRLQVRRFRGKAQARFCRD